MALRWAPELTRKFHSQAIGNTLLCSGEDRDFGGARYFFSLLSQIMLSGKKENYRWSRSFYCNAEERKC